MIIRCRPMRPKDVAGAVAILAQHPVLGPRYGNRVDQLQSVWLQLLGCQAFVSIVFEEIEGNTVRLLAAAASVFATEDFVRELKTPPFFWIGPELVTRVAHGVFPLLSNKEIAEANSNGGLNLVLWHLSIDPGDTKRAEVRTQVSAAFFEMHRGFRLKELIALQAAFQQEIGWIMDGGAFFLNPADGSYASTMGKPTDEIFRAPHVFGLTRELALTKMSWIGSLFHFEAPQIGFSGSEQKLLLAALRGGTDDDLSHELAISVSGVKKAWCSVYDRAAEHVPKSILHHESGEQQWNGDRGKQKKQRLLAYLREHPEELRPYSLKTRKKTQVRAIQ